MISRHSDALRATIAAVRTIETGAVSGADGRVMPQGPSDPRASRRPGSAASHPTPRIGAPARAGTMF